MTVPIIPTELWPQDAHLHTWDSNGLGNWHRPSYGAWHHWASDIPLPPGHDWRVPVIRHQPAPAIDLERFRKPVEAWKREVERLHHDEEIFPQTEDAIWAEADRLLALIDGHGKSPTQAAWTDEQCAEFLAVAMRHVQVKGTLSMNEIRQGQARANALQPTNGEVE